MSESNKYFKYVTWSDEDNCYVGRAPGLISGIHGDDEAKLYADLCNLVEEVVTDLKEKGKDLPAPMQSSYSGKLSLRIDPKLHQTLAVKAAMENRSINNFIEATITNAVAQ